MATSVEDCKKMIAACEKAKRKLSIGYRLHFDPFNDQMMRLGQNRVFGKMNMKSGFAFNLSDPNRWRIKKSMAGGGPLMDLGIYCLQGSIYTFGELPLSLWAKNLTRNHDFFSEVEGTIEWEMTFPSGKAYCITSYEDRYGYLTANTEKGELKLSPAFIYSGLKGTTPNGSMNVKPINQQAAQIDAFAVNILKNSASLVSGEMGLRDNYIIEKIYESAKNDGAEVSLKDIPNILDLRKD
jgi:predicted dehydrogenase